MLFLRENVCCKKYISSNSLTVSLKNLSTVYFKLMDSKDTRIIN